MNAFEKFMERNRTGILWSAAILFGAILGTFLIFALWVFSQPPPIGGF